MIVTSKIKSKTTTPSITDWFKLIDIRRSDIILLEDGNKYCRLKILNDIINLPYTPASKLSIEDLLEKTDRLKSIQRKFKNTECVLRLVPSDNSLTKIRKKGGLLENNLKWFYKQNIEDPNYRVEVIPRCPNVKWSAIFIVDENAIWGEIVKGGISQLVKGRHKNKPTVFSYNYKRWHFSKVNHADEEEVLKKAIKKIKIDNKKDKNKLKQKLNSSFTHDVYIRGYFEFTFWPKEGVKFIDYNRQQAKMFKGFDVWDSIKRKGQELKGTCANEGIAEGKIKIIKDPKKATEFKNGDILVCKMIDINYLPLIKKSSAIITEEGNILCHAALISRELNKPCIIQVKNITKKLKNGSRVSLNAKWGEIKLLNT